MACYVKGHSGKHVMSTTEPEAHNVMHCHQMRTEPQPQVMCIDNNIVEFRHAVLEMSLQTHTHTDTDCLHAVADGKQHIQIFSFCLTGLFFWSYFKLFYLHCFDAVGWVAGRASSLKKLSGGLLAWLSVWSKVQTCIWPS